MKNLSSLRFISQIQRTLCLSLKCQTVISALVEQMYLDDKVKEADSLTLKIHELEMQLSKEKEEGKRYYYYLMGFWFFSIWFD